MQNSIIKDLSLRCNISEKHADEIVKNLWLNIKKDLSAATGRDIILSRFGTFYKDPNSVWFRMYKLKQFQKRLDDEFRNNKETISYEDWLKYITTWRNIQTYIFKLEKVEEAMNKRKKRQKGDRGL